MTSPSMDRQVWLDKAATSLRRLFKGKGHTVPDNIRFTIGWPKGGGGKAHTIGQCFYPEGSADEHHEIFVSPELGWTKRKTDGPSSSVRIMGVMAHEFSHSVAGFKAGHKKPFKIVAEAVGLEGAMTATTESAEFRSWAHKVLDSIGVYPAGKLVRIERNKQSTRLLKCECSSCGYLVRVTKKWVEEAGEPHCGTVSHGRMSCDMPDEEDDE